MADAAWAPVGPARYGLSGGAPSNTPTALSSIPSPAAGAADQVKLLSPENPLTIFAAIAAVAFGLMAFSTSVRVGNSKASLQLGDTGKK